MCVFRECLHDVQMRMAWALSRMQGVLVSNLTDADVSVYIHIRQHKIVTVYMGAI